MNTAIAKSSLPVDASAESPVPAFLSLEHLLQVPVPITYLAGTFPARSETFVYREVRALRLRGWNVNVVSLNDPAGGAMPGFSDLEKGRTIVYGSGRRATLLGFVQEIFNHPIAVAAKTLFTAAWLMQSIRAKQRSGKRG